MAKRKRSGGRSIPRTRRKGSKTRRKRAASGPVSNARAKKRRVAPSSHANKSIHKMKHPFSKVTDGAKIPDDSVTHSLSRTLQHVTEIQNAVGVTTMHILLHPTLGIGASVIGDASAAAARNVTYLGFHDQGMVVNGTNWKGAGVGTSQNLLNNTQQGMWRLLSEGFRLTLNNVSEENNGWFESCRIVDTKNLTDEWCLACADNTGTDYTQMGLGIREDGVAGMDTKLASLQMIEQPGYTNGNLTDLGKIEFKLNPISKTIGWNQMFARYQGTEGTDFTYNAADDIIDFTASTPGNKQVFESMMDFSHDMIYIRIHARDNTGVAPNTGSKLIAHIVQNVEFQLVPESDFVSFQTPSPGVKNIETVIAGLNDNATPTKNRTG